MHIPDGFLTAPVWAGLDAVAAPAVVFLAGRSQKGMEEGRIPLVGVMGAFVFAAQMINFPVGIGTSGHVVGAALLACTIGPAAASVAMAAVLAVQALIFQDGGVLALGANVFNMALAGVFAGYLPYRYWGGGRHRRAAIFAGGILSVLAAASLALFELRLSGVPMPPAIVGISGVLFLVSAVIEGAITVAVIGAMERINPDWVRNPAQTGKSLVGAIGLAAIVAGCFGALLASGLPDGLEKLAEGLGIAGRKTSFWASPLAGYELQGAAEPWLRKAGAGLAGLALIFTACLGVARLMAHRRSV